MRNTACEGLEEMDAAPAEADCDLFKWPQQEFEERYFLKKKINWLKKKVQCAMGVVGACRVNRKKNQPSNTLTFSELEDQCKELGEYIERIPHIKNSIYEILEMISKIHDQIRTLLLHRKMCETRHERLIEKVNLYKQQFEKLKIEKMKRIKECERWKAPVVHMSADGQSDSPPEELYNNYFGPPFRTDTIRLDYIDKSKHPLNMEINQLRLLVQVTMEYAKKYKTRLEGIARLWRMYQNSRLKNPQSMQSCRELSNLSIYQEEFTQKVFQLQDKFNVIMLEAEKFLKVKAALLTQKKICDTVHVKLGEKVNMYKQHFKEDKQEWIGLFEEIHSNRQMHRHNKNREMNLSRNKVRGVIPRLELPEPAHLSGLFVECKAMPLLARVNRPKPAYKPAVA